jgi:hypothetical protein
MTSADGKWGGLEVDGRTWSGVIGTLIRGEADLSTSALTMTLNRARAVDFTYPIFYEQFSLI